MTFESIADILVRLLSLATEFGTHLHFQSGRRKTAQQTVGLQASSEVLVHSY